MCKYSQLAARGPFRVDVCEDCHCIHVHMGPVSFRLDESAAHTLREVLSTALAKNSSMQDELDWSSLCETQGYNRGYN